MSRATVHVRLLDRNDNPPVLGNFEILFNNYVTNRSSSFPGGAIGRVPAHDPDISDSLTYSFERGNELSLVLLNASTGELRLSRALDNNRPLEAIMSVLVSGKEGPRWCQVGAAIGGGPGQPSREKPWTHLSAQRLAQRLRGEKQLGKEPWESWQLVQAPPATPGWAGLLRLAAPCLPPCDVAGQVWRGCPGYGCQEL